MRVVHLLRPAQGGMLHQVRALLTDPAVEGLLAAPPDCLARLAEVLTGAPLPLPATDSLRAQVRAGIAAGRWARRVGADVLHGHGLSRTPLYALAARRSRVSLVVTLHNQVGALSAAQRLAVRLSLAQARRTIAVSAAVARSAQGLVPGDRLRVVHNGIDTVRFAGLPSRADARRQLGLDPDATIVLCVARLSPEKGIDVLVEALRGEPVQLLVAGDGPEKSRLAALNGGVRWLGESVQVPLLMAASNLYAQPSRDEGLGLAVLEAQAAGLPVVVSAVGGLPEAVGNDVSGVLVPPDDPSALRVALRELRTDLERAQRLGAAGRQRVAERFTVEAMRAATRVVYAEALA